MIFSGVWGHVIRMGACQVLEGIFVEKAANSLLLPCASARGGEKGGPVPFCLFSSVNIRLPGRGWSIDCGRVRAWCCRRECGFVQDYCSGDRPSKGSIVVIWLLQNWSPAPTHLGPRLVRPEFGAGKATVAFRLYLVIIVQTLTN